MKATGSFSQGHGGAEVGRPQPSPVGLQKLPKEGNPKPICGEGSLFVGKGECGGRSGENGGETQMRKLVGKTL